MQLMRLSQSLELLQPTRNPVPTGAVLVHHPSLALATERASYGWQATRRVSTVAPQARRWTSQQTLVHACKRAEPLYFVQLSADT